MNAPPFPASDHPSPSRRRRDVIATLPLVLGLPEIEAAAAIGLSQTKFREMVAAGDMPKPRIVGGKLSYDVDELRAAYKAMPHQGDAEEAEVDTWADVKPKAESAS